MSHGQLAGRNLRAERAHRGGGRSDEPDAGGLARLRERGLLGKKTVARMKRRGAMGVRDLDDPVELEVRLGGRCGADVMRLVRVANVDRVAVRVRIDRGGRDAQLAACAHDADRDLAAIGDEDLTKEFLFHPTARSGWFGLTTSPSLT